ncbi:LuxR family transcriptional regulator [Defluviimonas sp. 20V17]|uniref:LuxR family transcriptional regulator n=1 Tax=Allgaiera indica TaxID=765699 RepID=A0AAN5A0C1_9RHOB|nr:helix-turn-helix transcriptional regulator [Allgaiera indica]KDB02515.1 LuxR family transcriptional regulator [Defluviimonas sp. 20V17]GHE01930.1 LuxR family transcriptional regulator [Allgaiera indica]SDX01983.1 regulatory protein, luxR family [Allgaiera indica]
MSNSFVIAAILIVQALCTVFFVSEIVNSVFGLSAAPIPWEAHEMLQVGAALGLLLGVLLGALALARTVRRHARVERQLRAVSIAFLDLLEERFADWGLTPAERDVALFAIKGLSTAEIAQLRETSEGTVKAQTAAIYRKAGVSGRSQLLSLFIEDMLAEDGPRGPAATPQSAA